MVGIWDLGYRRRQNCKKPPLAPCASDLREQDTRLKPQGIHGGFSQPLRQLCPLPMEDRPPPILHQFPAEAKQPSFDATQNPMSSTTNSKLELIFGRRSVRIYSPGTVDETAVRTLLEAAMAGPSAMTKDPWRFVVVRRTETLRELAAALPGGKMLATAAVAIIVCGDQEAAFEQNISYLLQDCSAATENLLLAAHGLGLGACWVGVHPGAESIRRVRELLALPESIVPVAAIAVGRPGEQLPARTRYNESYVHAEKW
jgi:nitroreductase